MQTNTINLTDEATRAINALQHPCGTYDYYRTALNRIFSYILHCSDEIGMSDSEAISTIRALDGIRSDLAAIAGPAAPLNEHVDPFDGITLTTAPDELDEGAEAIKDLNNALDRVRQANYILIEAAEHAERAGKSDAITARMGSIQAHLANATFSIDDAAKCYQAILHEGKTVTTPATDSQTADTAE